jgi:hypothetical protein
VTPQHRVGPLSATTTSLHALSLRSCKEYSIFMFVKHVWFHQPHPSCIASHVEEHFFSSTEILISSAGQTLFRKPTARRRSVSESSSIAPDTSTGPHATQLLLKSVLHYFSTLPSQGARTRARCLTGNFVFVLILCFEPGGMGRKLVL